MRQIRRAGAPCLTATIVPPRVVQSEKRAVVLQWPTYVRVWHTICLAVSAENYERPIDHGCLLTRTRASLAPWPRGRGRARRWLECRRRECRRAVAGRASRAGRTRGARERGAQHLLTSHPLSPERFAPRQRSLRGGGSGNGPPCPLSFLPAGFFLGQSVDGQDLDLPACLQVPSRLAHRLYRAHLADHFLDDIPFDLRHRDDLLRTQSGAA